MLLAFVGLMAAPRIEDAIPAGTVTAAVPFEEEPGQANNPQVNSMLAAGNYIFTAMGYSSGTNYNTHQRGDYSGVLSWLTITSLPYTNYSGAGAHDGTNFFVMGGNSPASNLCYRWDGVSWTQMANMLTACGNIQAAYYTGKIYLPAGYNGSYLTTFQIYNIAGNSWSNGPALPIGQSGNGVTVCGNYLYSIGGGGSQTSVVRLDLTNPLATWQAVANHPAGVYYGRAASVGGFVYSVGGWSNNATAWRYDPVLNSWTQLANLNTGRQRLGLVGVNGKLYAFGGGNGWSAGYATVEVYDPANPGLGWQYTTPLNTGLLGVAEGAPSVAPPPPDTSDIEVLSIDAPGTWGISPDTVPTGMTYAPKATVRNNGPKIATFSVEMKVTAPGVPNFTSTKTVTSLAIGASTQVTFDNWVTPRKAGLLCTDSVKANNPGDPVPANNVKAKQYFTKCDVGFYDPIDPIDSVYVNYTYNPTARIKLFTAGATEMFVDSCYILDTGGGVVYVAARNDSFGLGQDTEHIVLFEDWLVPPDVGVTYEINIFSRLPGDFNPLNDGVIWQVVSVPQPGIDAGTVSIDEPAGQVKVGETVKPKATVQNFGQSAATFDVTCTIDTWTSTKSVVSLAKDATQQVTFDDWTPTTAGSDNLIVFTKLTGDGNASNDTMKLMVTVGVTEDHKLPTAFSLEAARPNPVSTWTNILYALPVNSQVTLAVYDITGKLVKTLVLGSENAGYKSVRWDGRDNAGKPVPNGLYFIRLETPKYAATGKLVLTR
jgi:hypothetical protein